MRHNYQFLLLVFLTLIGTNSLLAQWVQTNGPYGGYISCLVTCPDGAGGINIFAGTGGHADDGNGVFLSTNGGGSWTAASNGLPASAIVNSLIVTGTTMFAGLNGGYGVYRSTSDGGSWTAVNNGLPSQVYPSSFGVSGSNIFMGTIYSGGVYRSTDNGSSWTPVNNGLDSETVYYGVNTMTVNGNSIFLGTQIDGIYRSTDNGASWVYCGFRDSTILSLAVSGTSIFAGRFGSGVYRSTDNGSSWMWTTFPACNVLAFAVSPNGTGSTNIFAGTRNNGVFLSTDNGESWSAVDDGLPTNYSILSLAVSSRGAGRINLLAGNNRGVYLSTDNGATWNEADSGLTGINNRVIAGSTNGGGSTNLFLGTGSSGMFRSNDNGTNWSAINNGFEASTIINVLALAISGTKLCADVMDMNMGIRLSTDNGESWIQCGTPPPYDGVIPCLGIGNDRDGGTNVFYGTHSGLFLSTDNCASWTSVKNALPSGWVQSLAVSGTNIFASLNAGLYHSTDNGNHWAIVTGLTVGNPTSLAMCGTNIFAGSANGTIFLSTNNGTSWTQAGEGLPGDYWVKSLTTSDANVFAMTSDGRIWKRRLSELVPSIWQADITVKDNGNVSQTLSFGTSPMASDGIDPDLAEAALPPPAFGFDARFHLPTGDESWKDFRSSDKDSIEWMLKFQPGNGGYPMTFSWDTSKLGSGSFHLKDMVTGTVVNVDMKKTSSYILTNSGISELVIEFTNVPAAITAPSVPVLLAPANGAVNQRVDTLLLTWNASAGAKGYNFQLSTNPKFLSTVNSDSTSDTVITALKLSNSAKYFWRVLAYNEAGASRFTSIDSFTTIVAVPSPPNLVFPVDTTGIPRRTTISWDSCAFATHYRVQVATDESFSNVVFDSVLTNTLVRLSSPLTGMTQYFWHVNATDTAGTSDYSGAESFTTGAGIDAVDELGMIPKDFSLCQNYPNPFNPSTVIRYGLPKISNVRIKIYNLLGQKLETIIDGTQSAGYHEVSWNGSNKASGIYFCTIEAVSADGKGNFRSAKKLILLK